MALSSLLAGFPSQTSAAQPQDMKELFSEANSIQTALDIEAALARVEARLGVIPQTAADEITRKADIKYAPPNAVADMAKTVDHPLVAMINVWRKAMAGGAGEYIHYGATTMDVFDTLYVIQLRAAANIILKDLRDIEAILMSMAQKHRDTPVVWRTLGQHGTVQTFGLKVSIWVAENRRNIERLKDCMKRLNTGTMNDEGSYAFLAGKGPQVEAALMKELGLDPPEAVTWKSSRDKHAEFGNVLAMIGMTFGKVGQEIFLLNSTDIGEVEEEIMKVGSSSLPHKRNPNKSRSLVVQARKIRRNAEVLLDWMVSIHERDQINSAGELKDLCLNMDDQLKVAKSLLGQLTIKPEVMLQNIQKTKGLIMAPELMAVLGNKIGRRSAHEVVRKLGWEAFEKNMSLKEVILSHPEVMKNLEVKELDDILDPAKHLALSPQVVDRVIEETQKKRATDPKSW